MKIITANKKAYHNYEVLETLETGIVLTGDEVKSLRAGKVSLDESFAIIQQNQLVLLNCYIAPYSHAYMKADASKRTRVLLAHRRQIMKLIGEISRKGLTLIPLKLFLNARGLVKVLIGIARHKKLHNKKQELKERDLNRSASREIKIRIK